MGLGLVVEGVHTLDGREVQESEMVKGSFVLLRNFVFSVQCAQMALVRNRQVT